MDSYHQTHHFPRAPPPPPPPPSSSSAAADPYHHQPSLRPPVPPQGPWFPNQFQYHPSHSASPTPPPPPSQWGPPVPHSDHAPPPPPPPGAYPPHPYASQPMHHNPFPPPRPLMFQHPPHHSQVPQPYSQEWNNPNWAPHQGWEYRAQSNEEDWAARARAWADAKTAMENQQSQFAPTGRLEEQNYYHDQYSQPINSNHPDISHQPLPPSIYDQFSASATSVARPPAAHHLESTPVTVSSEHSSYPSDGRPTYAVGDVSYGGNMNSSLHHQGKLSSSPSVHQQEVPSSNYSVTGKEDIVDQNGQSFKSLPLQNSSVHDGLQHFQPPNPPAYAYGNDPGPVGPVTNLADQPLDFAPRFGHDHGLRAHAGFARNDSGGSTRGIDSDVPMPSLNSWSSISPGMVYPPIPPPLASATQLDPSVAVPSVPGHTPPPFGRIVGSGISPAIPPAATPFPGAALPPPVISGDAYGMSSMSERPKKASVPNWLREEIKKAVITSSSADHPKEDAELMEDRGVDKSFAKNDQTDSKSIDSSRSTEEEDDEDFVEGARTAEINQEIKRVLTEVLLKVTDELFDEIATKVLDEDDLAVEAKPNQNVSSSTLPVSTPKGSAKILIPIKVQESDNDDASEKSNSSSPGDVLGLGNYASDDEKNDDRDGESQSSNVQGSNIKANMEPSSPKRNLRDTQDAVKNPSSQENVIEHSGNHTTNDINDGSTSSANEMSKSTGSNKLNGNRVDEEMGQEHSLKPSSKGLKDNEKRLGDGTASGTKDNLGMVSEQHGKNFSGKKGSKDSPDWETKIKPHKSGKQESASGSSLKDGVKEEGEVKTRTSEKADEIRRKQEHRHRRKEEKDDQHLQKENLKDQGVKTGEKGKVDSRHRSTHHNSKEEKREDKLLRVSTKDDTDRKRDYAKDEEGRTRQKISSDSSRHKSGRDRTKAKVVDHNSSDDSDVSKRKVNSRKRDKSPSPIRSKRRQVSRSPHSKHSQRRHAPFSSLETTSKLLQWMLQILYYQLYFRANYTYYSGRGGQDLGPLQDGADDCRMAKRILTNCIGLETQS
ncbi:transcription elongation regulator 1-like isoform X1 [Cucumis melo var. makuwa]|uniref:Transcription elongation regulator 1-like isoform X1 n=1 Tax=Cucumis melo var. makuwa TaxID=1194695 RepID=A0A5D3CXH8_CUCMM|nr:transcription elongation regulator 1-like isoform X1 [Cucumis melo var. makuwa]